MVANEAYEFPSRKFLKLNAVRIIVSSFSFLYIVRNNILYKKNYENDKKKENINKKKKREREREK